ncbi:hypothetical protein DZK27_16790 [Rhodobacteraceae bacterium 63075]|nr:hypothetical protein DZK27_16790 [Rhodobacteraceae bacterium 63075]
MGLAALTATSTAAWEVTPTPERGVNGAPSCLLRSGITAPIVMIEHRAGDAATLAVYASELSGVPVDATGTLSFASGRSYPLAVTLRPDEMPYAAAITLPPGDGTNTVLADGMSTVLAEMMGGGRMTLTFPQAPALRFALDRAGPQILAFMSCQGQL